MPRRPGSRQGLQQLERMQGFVNGDGRIDNAVWLDGDTLFLDGQLAPKTGPLVNVRGYGAVLDGVSDDTQAIQSAYDACQPGSTLYVPLGNARVTSLPVITKSIRVAGEHPGALGVYAGGQGSRVTFTGATGVQVGDASASQQYQRITIENLQLIASGATPTKCIWLNGGSTAFALIAPTIRNVLIDMSGASGTCDGIYASGTVTRPVIGNCFVYAGRDSISFQGSAIQLFNSPTVLDTYCNNPSRYCLNVQLVTELVVHDCELDSSAVGTNPVLNLQGVNGFSFVGTILRGNNAGTPVQMQNSATGPTGNSGGVFHGCYFDKADPGATGTRDQHIVTSGSTHDIAIIGCTFVRYGTTDTITFGGTDTAWTVLSCGGVQFSSVAPLIVGYDRNGVLYLNGANARNFAATVLVGSGGNNTVAIGGTVYAGFGLGNSMAVTDETIVKITLPYAGTLRNLRVQRTAQGAGGSCVATVMVNGVATSIVATMTAGSGGGLVSDLSNTATVALGDTVSVRFVNNDGAAVSGAIRAISLELDAT